MPSKDKYTDPKLRDEVKEEIQQGDKGGEPGQWSARKAQMMAKEYKKRGGDYNTDKSEKDESQKNLSKWGEEDWQTKEGSGEAKKDDGSRKRYLPKKAWEQMSEEEKKQTDDKKQEESKAGKQHVGNTSKAKDARKNATRKSSNQNKSEDDEEGENDESVSQGEKEQASEASDNDDQKGNGKENTSPPSSPSRKRSRSQQKEGDSKKQKANDGSSKKKSNAGGKSGSSKQSQTVGSKHDNADPPAAQASSDRLPKQGTKAHWKALPGWVDGEVVEVVKTSKKVDGKQVKGSRDDPRIVLKSSKSGKICVHKVDNVYFD